MFFSIESYLKFPLLHWCYDGLSQWLGVLFLDESFDTRSVHLQGRGVILFVLVQNDGHLSVSIRGVYGTARLVHGFGVRVVIAVLVPIIVIPPVNCLVFIFIGL